MKLFVMTREKYQNFHCHHIC